MLLALRRAGLVWSLRLPHELPARSELALVAPSMRDSGSRDARPPSTAERDAAPGLHPGAPAA
jgi:hypothetical protein